MIGISLELGIWRLEICYLYDDDLPYLIPLDPAGSSPQGPACSARVNPGHWEWPG